MDRKSVMTDDQITNLLFVCDEPEIADLIMVFGAANESDMVRRTRRGVELYKAGFASRLLVSGGGVLARSRPEARRMADIALEMGVPVADLLVEDRSANTFENVQFSCELLQTHSLLEELDTVLLVSSEWHMRRLLLTAKKFMPAKIRFLCYPTLDRCNRTTWTNSELCRSEVENEAMLIGTFLETGALSRDSSCWRRQRPFESARRLSRRVMDTSHRLA